MRGSYRQFKSVKFVLKFLMVAEAQSLKIDTGMDDPEDDPFMAKLSFEVSRSCSASKSPLSGHH